MNQEKIGKFIKNIRKENHLTQKELGDKYNVTYQAVSKWERGINMPDTSLIKQMSKDFNVSIEELLDGEYNTQKKKSNFIKIIFITIIVIILTILLYLIIKPHLNNNFQFKTLSSSCDTFNISGNIAYNQNKTAIYITNIKYCGGNDFTEYKKIECTLYEKQDDILKKVSTIEESKEKIKLEDFLKNATLKVFDYQTSCKYYENDNFYLLINATDGNDKITSYQIPLKLDNCN